MKKAFKYIMLALLIIPCALVFTACGSKDMSKKDFARFSYDSYVAHIKSEDYENYKDIKVTVTSNDSEVSKDKYDIKTGSGDTVKMEYKSEIEIENTLTYERTGKGDKVVVKVTKTSTTTTTVPTYQVDTMTVSGSTKTIETEKTTYYLGQVAATGETTEASYYAIKEYEKTKTTSVDGAKPEEDTSVKENNVKTIEKLEDKEVFKENVEILVNAVNTALFENTYSLVSIATMDTLSGEAPTTSNITKDGKNVKVNLEMVLGYSEMYIESDVDISFNNDKLSKVTAVMKGEADQGTNEVSTTYSYNYTSNAKLPENFDDAAVYKTGDVIGDSFANDIQELFGGLDIELS